MLADYGIRPAGGQVVREEPTVVGMVVYDEETGQKR
jgi:hypothetical protein